MNFLSAELLFTLMWLEAIVLDSMNLLSVTALAWISDF